MRVQRPSNTPSSPASSPVVIITAWALLGDPMLRKFPAGRKPALTCEKEETMASVASLTACVLFLSAMLHVIVTDLRHRRIRNWLVAGSPRSICRWRSAAGTARRRDRPAASVAALLVFAAGFGAFAAGWVGGGDVKLAAVVRALARRRAGAAVPDLRVPFRRRAGARGAGGQALLPSDAAGAAPGDAQASGPRRLALPYGPALAMAGMVLLSQSPMASAL